MELLFRLHYKTTLSVAVLFIITSSLHSSIRCETIKSNDKPSNYSLHLCEVCTELVDSFKAAMAKTDGKNFGGGDADWEEKNLGSYSNSEVRFIEIQEQLCVDSKFKTECLLLAERYEEILEGWWYRESRSIQRDLRQYLCVDVTKRCGPMECGVGWIRNTRLGCRDLNECESDPCKYDEYCVNTDGSYLCRPCDPACQGCTGEGVKHCIKPRKKRSPLDEYKERIEEEKKNPHRGWSRAKTYFVYACHTVAFFFFVFAVPVSFVKMFGKRSHSAVRDILFHIYALSMVISFVVYMHSVGLLY